MASHNKKYTMFSQSPNKEASVGVQNVAEFGDTSALKEELNAAEKPVTGKSVHDITMASGALFPNKQVKNIGQLEMDISHRTISSISMIAPRYAHHDSYSHRNHALYLYYVSFSSFSLSLFLYLLVPFFVTTSKFLSFSSPDWFTGISNYRPIKDGKWLQSFTVDTYPWDAGTDSGDTYTASNSATTPKEPVYQILNDFPVNNVFVGQDGNSVLPVGKWSCIKVEETDCKEDENAKFFRNMKDGRVQRNRCRWLGKKEARKKVLFQDFNTYVGSFSR